MLESLFNKVAGLKTEDFLKVRRPAVLLRRDSNTGAIIKKLQQQSFADTFQNRCF